MKWEEEEEKEDREDTWIDQVNKAHVKNLYNL